ncbi:MAG: hypothetical protein AB1721_02715 [Patescibacteria group bacterium]
MEAPKTFSSVSKTKRLPSSNLGVPKSFIFGSLAFLLVALAFYLFLSGYAKVAQSQIKSLDREIQDMVASISLEEVEKVITLDAQIRGLKKLLPGHYFVSSAFDFLENNTNPNISFRSLKLDTRNNVLYLEGVSPDLREISIQSAAFSQHPEINDVVLRDINNVGDSFNFKLELSFSKSLILIK